MLVFAVYLTLAMITGRSFWRARLVAMPRPAPPPDVDRRITETGSGDDQARSEADKPKMTAATGAIEL